MSARATQHASLPEGPPVSVIVASRGRPSALSRCLTALGQLQYAPVEIVVVADEPGIAAIEVHPLASHVKTIPFTEPNLSAARNAGLAAAAGEIVAFIDDDAVPEPSWLSYLVSAFSEPDIFIAGGFVRARNGISLQWGARMVDTLARPLSIKIDGQTPVAPGNGRVAKVEGTNMAFRRSILEAEGGFDEAFRYFLDETDLCLRLRKSTMIVPEAEVHHGFAENATRRADRAPRDLHEIGASWSVFLKGRPEAETRWNEVIAEQSARLETHLVAGRLEPRDMRRLLDSLRRGFDEGLTRRSVIAAISRPSAGFLELPVGVRADVTLSGWWSNRAALRAEARDRAAKGQNVSLYLFSPSSLFHRVSFDPAGFWEQSGGLFGKSLRSDPIFRPWRFARRLDREEKRTAPVRICHISKQ